MEAVVDVDAGAGDAGREGGAEERRGLANLHGGEGLFAEGRVGHGVVDHVVDEADRLGRAGAEGTRGDGVDADAPLAASLVRQHLGVGLERRLGAGHAAAVPRDDLLGREVGEGDGGAALVHDGAEALDEGHVGVGGRGEGREVAVAGGLQKGLLHLRAVGERVHEDVNLAEILLNLRRALRDGPVLVAGVALVGADVLRDVLHGVEDGVERVHLGELHQGAVGELAGSVELAAAERRLEDVERGDPGAEDDLAAGVREALGDGPAEALVIGDAGDESLLACDAIRKVGRGDVRANTYLRRSRGGNKLPPLREWAPIRRRPVASDRGGGRIDRASMRGYIYVCGGRLIAGKTATVTPDGNVPRRSMGRVRSVCAARTVMREAARGALRALRAPVRSTLAVNCWVAMAEDMVEEGVVE